MIGICAKQTYAMKTENFRFGSKWRVRHAVGDGRYLGEADLAGNEGRGSVRGFAGDH